MFGIKNKKNGQIDHKQEQLIADKTKGVAIAAALEMKQSFEMYAYRIIGHEDFTQRVKETCNFAIKAMNQIENTKGGQIDLQDMIDEVEKEQNLHQ